MIGFILVRGTPFPDVKFISVNSSARPFSFRKFASSVWQDSCRRSKPLFYAVFCLMACMGAAYGQCPSSITTTAPDVVAADCPSSGQILVHSSAESEPSATYQIISGPASGGYQTTAQSSNNFTALPAGDYTIRITCGSATAEVNATVADQYTPISLTVAVTDVCSSGNFGNGNNRTAATTSTGSTITATATGGKAPLTYAFLFSSNPAEPDANFTYSSSNVFITSAFGEYQVRVKDACNNFVTQSVDVQPIYPLARLNFGDGLLTCSTATVTAGLVRESDGTSIDPEGSGYTLEIWYVPSTSPCAYPGWNPDQTKVINSSSDLDIVFPSSVEMAVVRTLSVCGEQHYQCIVVPKPLLVSQPYVHIGCSAADSVNLSLDIFGGVAPYNVTVQGYDAGGSPVSGTSLSFVYSYYDLVSIPTADHYTYTVTDACGNTLTQTVTTPTPGDAPALDYYSTFINCVNVAGTTTVVARVFGFIPNQDLSQIKLINAATNAFVANAVNYTAYNGAIYFENIPPGDYKIVFTPNDSSCPPSEVPLSIPVSTEGLVFALDGTATQLCGGTGTITAELNYNGPEFVTFELLQGSTVIASNTAGTFTNLPSGTYTLKAVADLSQCGKPNLETTKDLVIQPGGSDPVVVKKLGINCTNDPATGLAAFEFSGFGPFLLEMKKVTETNFVTIDTAATNNYTASGLAADTDYDVRITDQCGNTSVTQVSVRPLVAVYVTNTAQPCLDQPYTLTAEDIPNASYSWTFNNGPVIATSKDVVFGTYSAANNGTYTCTITLDYCVSQVLTVNLNSINCSQPLAKSGIGDYVWKDDNINGLQDGSEPAVSGITVTLYGSDGNSVLATTTTDANGYYSFGGLTAGSYVVGFSGLPTGYVFSPSPGALNDADNNDADIASGKTGVISLADNEFNLNIDAGIYNSMPVTLISFEAMALEQGAYLNWSTATETNSDRFEVEHSTDGRSWKLIGTVRSHGESSSVKYYHYTDKAALAGENFYRLRMVDSDLSYSYSRIQKVVIDTRTGAVVYPNPVSDLLMLKNIPTSSIKLVTLLNGNGEMVYHSMGLPAAGINVKTLPPGLYTLKIKKADGRQQVFKVAVVR